MKGSFIFYLFFLQFLFVPHLRGDVFQWTDSRGVIHFVDSYHAVPEEVRESQELLVHKTAESSIAYREERIPEARPKPPQGEEQEGKPREPDRSKIDHAEPEREAPSIVQYNLRQTNIIVVQRIVRFPRKGKDRSAGVFQPSFDDRRYIHPSAFDRGPRPFVRPSLFGADKK